MSNLERIRARIKRKQELISQGYSEEAARAILDKKNINENAVKTNEKIALGYCFQCKTKAELNNSVIIKKEIKPGSYRNILQGSCSLCNKKVATITKNND